MISFFFYAELTLGQPLPTEYKYNQNYMRAYLGFKKHLGGTLLLSGTTTIICFGVVGKRRSRSFICLFLLFGTRQESWEYGLEWLSLQSNAFWCTCVFVLLGPFALLAK
jgi:hypothetical protein